MIIGHQQIIKYLSNIIKADTPSHAYLFHGPSQVGKTTTAKWFAQSMLCESNRSGPCEKCQNCQLIAKNHHPDFNLIESEQDSRNITIKQIRNLQAKITKTAFYNSYKIVIIKDADNLNIESSNAFLKILEEPPKQTIFILISDNFNALVPTILSRTEIIKFSLIKAKDIVNNLNNSYNIEQKKFIAGFVQGKIGQAFELNPTKIKDIIEQEKIILQMIKAWPDQKINLIEKNLKNDLPILPNYAASLIRDLMLFKIGSIKLITHHYMQKELQKISARVNLTALHKALEYLISWPNYLKTNVNEKLLWQNLFLIN